MRVTIDHREERGRENVYALDCTVLFSDEEKGIIAQRGLADHYLQMPKGYVAVLDPTEDKRIYSLKTGIAAGVSLIGILSATASSALGAILFLSGAVYALWSLYHWLRPPLVSGERVRLGGLVRHKRFTVALPNPVRAKEIEAELLASINDMKQFLQQSIDLATRTVHEF